MLTLREIFERPGQVLGADALSRYALDAQWFPEINELREALEPGTRMCARIEADGRLQVRELAYRYHDHRRSTAILTVWFDHAPLMMVQLGAQSSGGHRFFVVDNAAYQAASRYMRSLLEPGDSCPHPAYDMDAPFYEDELCQVDADDFMEALGVAAPATVKGALLVPMGKAEPGQRFLVVAPLTPQLSHFVRRGAHVFEQVAMTDLAQLAGEFGESNLARALGPRIEGHQFAWYRASARPSPETPVLRV